MKIILLATWPNGQTQHIYSTTSRLIAKSQFNQKLNRHIIEVAGPDAKFIAECVWNARAVTPAVPMVVDENYDPIPLGSELGPNISQGSVSESDASKEGINTHAGKADEPENGAGNVGETPTLENTTNEPNKKAAIPPVEEIRQDLPESRELPVLPEQPAAQEPEAVAEVDDDLTVNEDADPEADMPLEELICKRIAEFTKLKVTTIAANLGVTEDEVRSAVKKSDFLKITGSKKVATVSAK